MRSKPRILLELVLGDEDHTQISKGALAQSKEVIEYSNLSLDELEAAEAAMHAATVEAEKSLELVHNPPVLAIELPKVLIPKSVFEGLGEAVESISMQASTAIQPLIQASRQVTQNHLQGLRAITKASNDFTKAMTDIPRIDAALEHIDLLGNENREAINQIAAAVKPVIEQFSRARTEMSAATQHLGGYVSSGLPTLSSLFCGLGTASSFSQSVLGTEFNHVLSGVKTQFQENQKLLDGLPQIGAANAQLGTLLRNQQDAISEIAKITAPQIDLFAKIGEPINGLLTQLGSTVKGIFESIPFSVLTESLSSIEVETKKLKRTIRYFKRRIGYLANARIRPIIGGDLLELPISALTRENIQLLIEEVLNVIRELGKKALLKMRKLALLVISPKAHPSPRMVDAFLKTHPPPQQPIQCRPAVQPNAPAC
jgi:hypothetical protein